MNTKNWFLRYHGLALRASALLVAILCIPSLNAQAVQQAAKKSDKTLAKRTSDVRNWSVTNPDEMFDAELIGGASGVVHLKRRTKKS